MFIGERSDDEADRGGGAHSLARVFVPITETDENLASCLVPCPKQPYPRQFHTNALNLLCNKYTGQSCFHTRITPKFDRPRREWLCVPPPGGNGGIYR